MSSFFKAFQRYGNKHQSLEKRFLKPDDRSTTLSKWFDQSLEKATPVGLLKFCIAYFPARIRYKESKAYSFLANYFADVSEKEETLKSAIDVFQRICDCKISVNEKGCATLDFGKRTVQANRLSDVYPDIAEHFNGMEKGGRRGHCHWDSIALLTGFTNFEGATLVNGIVKGATGKIKWFHSWIEQNIDGIECCIDTTTNLVMPKDDYYYLQGVKVIQKIPQAQVEQDNEMLLRLYRENKFNTKVYCYSRDEALKKYEKLVKEDEEYERRRAENERLYGTKYISGLFVAKEDL